ncbi:RNA chaperone Hfq [Paenibacillus senegalimassiliensis]|uniref:RNA chaperone Hfq n=1 Tax=Paenibacillus senegalimassiliensis TaxID=1737426 RepID=UPI00073ECC3A|nr:RNA chaperone Hfq [Paenibacillus senegalimassiliensis]
MPRHESEFDINQDKLLNSLKKEQTLCTIITKNGVPIKGKIAAFDKFVILVNTQIGKQSMVYKHAVSTIVQG